jgi:8-oxo-dGTP pyrophosphatase MutT (NUDIX family)
VYRKKGGDIEVLLLARKNGKGENEYVLPKGHMEGDETAKDTALREISEETGLPADELEVIKFMTKINYSFIATHKEGSPVVDKDVYLFLVKYRGNAEPTPFRGAGEPGERFTGFKWFRVDELKNANVKPDIHSFIRKNLQYL